MDELDEIDELLIGKELSGGWVIREPRRIERDAPSACRSYVAHDAQGRVAFVKLLDPRANGALEDTQRQFEQFIYEKGVVDATLQPWRPAARSRATAGDDAAGFSAIACPAERS